MANSLSSMRSRVVETTPSETQFLSVPIVTGRVLSFASFFSFCTGL